MADSLVGCQLPGIMGGCDTLDTLADLPADQWEENTKFVTVMPYLWNGHGKNFWMMKESVWSNGGIELETSES